jgi:hypothetical protein
MSENVTSSKIMNDVDELVQNYIDTAKEQNNIPTRDETIEKVTDRLEQLLEAGYGNKEITCVVSGIAVGIAIVLQIEETLKKNEYVNMKSVTRND